MANTTNFNWETPDDTDLVKDGALAIRTLGNSIDTTLVDLKGGTTGQVLSKTSNTDMDFTWVTSDDANAIQNAIVDAKGDLIAASAADTPARLAVGNNGETLVADSSATTGLRWQGHIEAGKNALINGGFDIWQRGTSSTTTSGYLTADRWYLFSGGAVTWSRETTTVPAGSLYSMKVAAGATIQPILYQAIETFNAIQFAGKNVVFSVLAQASTSTGITIDVQHSSSENVGPTGSWTTITATSGGSGTATSSGFTKISGVFAIPSTAKSLMVRIYTSSTIASGVNVFIGQAQFELGSVATDFSRAGGTLAGELVAAQRYYYRVTASDAYSQFGFGMGTSATNVKGTVPFRTQLRTVPSSIDSGNLAVYDGTNVTAITSIALNNQTAGHEGGFSATVASGLTQYRPYSLITNNNTAGYIAFNAEL